MPELKLARVDTVHTVTEAVRQDGQRRQPRREPNPRARSPRGRLLATLYPAGDPETCEVDYVVDATGVLTAILVRDIATGAVLSRISARDLGTLQAAGDGAGLLYERRG